MGEVDDEKPKYSISPDSFSHLLTGPCDFQVPVFIARLARCRSMFPPDLDHLRRSKGYQSPTWLFAVTEGGRKNPLRECWKRLSCYFSCTLRSQFRIQDVNRCNSLSLSCSRSAFIPSRYGRHFSPPDKAA